MGEVADMMLDGTLCEGCGEFMGEGVGYSIRCSSCSIEDDTTPINYIGKVRCDICGKKVKEVGLNDHKRDVHDITP